MKWNEMKWNEMKWNEMKWNEMNWSEMKWNEMKWNELKWNEMKWNETKWNETKWNEGKLINYFVPGYNDEAHNLILIIISWGTYSNSKEYNSLTQTIQITDFMATFIIFFIRMYMSCSLSFPQIWMHVSCRVIWIIICLDSVHPSSFKRKDEGLNSSQWAILTSRKSNWYNTSFNSTSSKVNWISNWFSNWERSYFVYLFVCLFVWLFLLSIYTLKFFVSCGISS